VGHHHACAVLATSSIRCWGSNLSGQLGIPDRRPPSCVLVTDP
jgi:alpha-tubulin suppressor-like RCC1 family protein